MGYVCPVCADPQADGEHLANHLAFTAMLGDDAHEDWLDEHAPDWADMDPAGLAERVTDDAEPTEYPQVFEDTTEDHGHSHDHNHGHSHDHEDDHGHDDQVERSAIDEAVPGGVADVEDTLAGDAVDPADVLAEARELTRERRANASADEDDAKADADEDNDTDDGSGVDDGG